MSATSTDATLVGLPKALLTLRSIVEKATGYECSPTFIDHGNTTPGPLMNSTFCFDLQTSNSNTYRDDTVIRMSHVLTVRVLYQVCPSDSFGSTVELLAVEERIMRALLDATATEEIRVSYKNTPRRLSARGEFIATDIIFDVEHDWYLGAAT